MRALAALALVAGCSSSGADTSSEEGTDQGAVVSSQSLKGAFSVKLDDHTVKFSYTMNEIDLSAKTVLRNAKITDKGGHPNVWDDENVRGKVTSVARCPGCFTVELPGSNAHPLAVVSVNSWKVTIVGGRDHGVYVNTGIHIAKTGAILVYDSDITPFLKRCARCWFGQKHALTRLVFRVPGVKDNG